MMTIEQKRRMLDGIAMLCASAAPKHVEMIDALTERDFWEMIGDISGDRSGIRPLRRTDAFTSVLESMGAIRLMELAAERLRKEIEEELNAAPSPRI